MLGRLSASRVAVIVVVAVLVLLGIWIAGNVAGGGGANENAAGPPPEVPAPANAPPASATVAAPSCGPGSHISWADAPQHIDSRVAIEGPVKSVSAGEGGAAQIVLGEGDARPVVVNLLPQAVQTLPVPAQAAYGGKTLCVVGVVQNIGGQLEMNVDRTSDISIY
jgi:hypothetical protein